MKRLPNKIRITKLAELLSEDPDSYFWREISQHLLENKFRGYITTLDFLAAYIDEDDEYGGGLTSEDLVFFPYYDARDIQLNNYCFNDEYSLKDSVFYENESMLLSSFVLDGTVWYPCKGADFTTKSECYEYEFAVESPLKIPFREVKFDTQDVIKFFKLGSEFRVEKPVVTKKPSTTDLRAIVFKCWLAGQSEDEVNFMKRSMKKEEVWQILGGIDKQLFPPLGGESLSDFFTFVGFIFKGGRRSNK